MSALIDILRLMLHPQWPRGDEGSAGNPSGGTPHVRFPGVDELIDVVDEQDRVVGQARRSEAYARRLRHRCAFILVRDEQGRIFVHRRTATKQVFPSLHDMWVGGVVGAGETYDQAALREAEEELGVTGLAPPTPLFTFLYETATHAWWSAAYEVTCAQPVRPQAEEVAWHTFLTDEELTAKLAAWEWVPDGLEAYRRLLEHRAGPAGDPT
jgi:isopentenyldiphosphate isomerase